MECDKEEVVADQQVAENGTSSGDSDEEKELLKLMREQVVAQDPASEAVDDVTLRCFLIAKSMNVNKASQMLVEHQKWRRLFVPLGHIPKEEIANELSKQKICLQGHDRQGRTIGVFLISRHTSFGRDLEELKRYVVYAFDKAIASTRDRKGQLTVIVDLEGWGYSCMDIRGFLAMLELMQDHYPDRLGKMILIHVPLLFWGAWKISYPFFNELTRQKILFVDDQNLKSALLKEIDEDQLPDIYGGVLPLVPA
eukprot:c8821_g1_i1 orf=670-1428(+)